MKSRPIAGVALAAAEGETGGTAAVPGVAGTVGVIFADAAAAGPAAALVDGDATVRPVPGVAAGLVVATGVAGINVRGGAAVVTDAIGGGAFANGAVADRAAGSGAAAGFESSSKES